MAKSNVRGHVVSYDPDGEWKYDDGVPISVERICVRCGRMPTPEGHDACLGEIPGACSACCGHGVVAEFVVMESVRLDEEPVPKTGSAARRWGFESSALRQQEKEG